MSSVGNYLTSKQVNTVYVGGQIDMIGSSPMVSSGFEGCVKVIITNHVDEVNLLSEDIF